MACACTRGCGNVVIEVQSVRLGDAIHPWGIFSPHWGAVRMMNPRQVAKCGAWEKFLWAVRLGIWHILRVGQEFLSFG